MNFLLLPAPPVLNPRPVRGLRDEQEPSLSQGPRTGGSGGFQVVGNLRR